MNNYTIESLEAYIEKIKANIKIFEEAIEKERAVIKETYEQIELLREKEKIRQEIEKNVSIEVERDGD